MTRFVGNIMRPAASDSNKIFVHVPHVCIIESPGALDILQKRREGFALSEALNLAGIRNEYYAVSSRDTFSLALGMIEKFAGIKQIHPNVEMEGEFYSVPRMFLHFSCHGNEHGIALTNNEFIRWSELGDALLSLGKALNLYREDMLSISQVMITMSSCSGLHGRKMMTNPKACPFIALVGSEHAVSWTDSLTAFITFYHHVIHKERCLQPAVKAMNDAAMRRGAFKALDAADVGAEGFSRTQNVCSMARSEEGPLSYVYDTTENPERKPLVVTRDTFCDENEVPLPFFDDVDEAIAYMTANRGKRIQVEHSAAVDLILLNEQGDLDY